MDHGLLIQEVSRESSAWQAGLRGGDRWAKLERRAIRAGGDILFAIDGQDADTTDTWSSLLHERTIGDTITLSVYRVDHEIELEVTLSERPASVR